MFCSWRQAQSSMRGCAPYDQAQRAVRPAHSHRISHLPVLCTAATRLSAQPDGAEELSAAAIDRFEQVAAALMTKLQDGEDVDHGFNLAAARDLLDDVHVDDDSEPSSSGATLQPFSLASTADVPYVPRKKRKQQLPMDVLPKVAVVGRPNVGKSALFNRLAGSNMAVVYDYPGVTRDRLYTRAFWGDKEYVLIDTGGLMSDATKLPLEQQAAAFKDISAEGLPTAIERQAAAGVQEADAVVMVVDGQVGLQAGDEEILAWLRQKHPGKRVLLAVNKCDNSQKADIMTAEFWETGHEPVAVSAISGTGTGELLDALMPLLPAPTSLAPEQGAEDKLSVAIIGRPNVGKSSLLNSICGEERAIVCDMSGTTRDAVDTEVVLEGGRKLVLIDTAGIRKRARVSDSKDGAEQLSVDRAIRAARRAAVVAMVVDGEEGVTQQDYRLSELAAAEGKAVVVVVNKWDRVDPELWSEETMAENIRLQLREVGWAEVVCTTATRGRKVPEVVECILRAGEQHQKRVSTATLNLVVREAVAWKGPPTVRGTSKQGRVYYATQVATGPPTFILFVNDTKLFPEDYRRYMERQLRENIGFPGTPIRLYWRGKAKAPAPAGSASGLGAATTVTKRRSRDPARR